MPKTCKSNEMTRRGWSACTKSNLEFSSSGRRVSNTWVTYLFVGDNSWKRLLIPNKIVISKGAFKASREDGPAAY